MKGFLPKRKKLSLADLFLLSATVGVVLCEVVRDWFKKCGSSGRNH